MSLADEIRNEIENIKELKITVGDINSHLSVLECLTRKDNEERDKESFQRGLAEGKKAFDLLDTERDAEYQRGLDEAMSAFKKLYSCGWERDWKAMGFEFDEGEWSRSFEFIIGHYTAAEIVEKVKAYEDKKIHVGDEVFAVGTRTAYLVTSLDGLVGGISKSGKVHLQPEEELTKTRKHYDSIDEYMKGEDNA